VFSPPFLLGFTLLAVAAVLIAARWCVHRWVRWAQRAADYAATAILNAKQVDSDEAVASLRAQFEAWSIVVKEGTARVCREVDAHRIQFFDVAPAPDVLGFNDEHRYIRQATAERVRRLLDLAERLKTGETRLRRYWVPRLG